MSKGKTHCRGARVNLIKANERNARRKARQQALKRGYDRQQYDKPAGEEQ